MKNFTRVFLSTMLLISFTNIASAEQESDLTFYLYGYPAQIGYGQQETIVESLRTGNHHCSSHCKGEPTRTSYRIQKNIDSSKFKIVGVGLTCNSGLCGFSDSAKTGFSENMAWGSFDVWSRPMLWTLNVKVKPSKVIRGKAVQIDSDVVQLGSTFIIIHDKKKYLDLALEVDIPYIGRIRIDPSAPPKKYFELISKTSSQYQNSYSLLYKQ